MCNIKLFYFSNLFKVFKNCRLVNSADVPVTKFFQQPDLLNLKIIQYPYSLMTYQVDLAALFESNYYFFRIKIF